jgi:predicted nuclease of restriction endonuclease-like (RecB) superfamily
MELRKEFLEEVKGIIDDSKVKAIRAVDHVRVKMYWELGRKIVEEEQQGMERAEYGKFLIKNLSALLQSLYGSGYSKRQLEMFRKFYLTFPIAHAVRAQFTWRHYRIYISIENQHKREFYQQECIKNTWSYRQLERQLNAGLYERLLLSNDPESVLSVARSEKQPIDAKEIIKDPIVLEFLGLKPESTYFEKDLESRIISHLQEFLLELGNGFAFMSRQKRIHLDGDDFFIDLVLYNRLLQCFVIIEIKTSKISHQDIGQLQMYVNYHDRYERKDHENPTIGILLCADKNDTVVKITLPENNQTIVASKYQLYLPSEQQLLEVVRGITLPQP